MNCVELKDCIVVWKLGQYLYLLFICLATSPSWEPRCCRHRVRKSCWETERECLCLEAVTRHSQAECGTVPVFQSQSILYFDWKDQSARHSHTDMTPVLASDWSMWPSPGFWLADPGPLCPLSLSGLVSGHHSPARVKSSIGNCKKLVSHSKMSNTVEFILVHLEYYTFKSFFRWSTILLEF